MLLSLLLLGQLVELTHLDSSLRLDIRYATSHNFMHRRLYPAARAFLVEPAARALIRVQDRLRRRGLGLVIFDGYRPWRVTKAMWDQTPPGQRQFVADPQKGSRHNRGCAVDVSLVDLETGKYAEMPSRYDEFSERAYGNYTRCSPRAGANRALLKQEMSTQGFTVLPEEWWHFDYQGWEGFPVLDYSFQELDG